MSAIVHISDLHLGKPAEHQLLNAHKSTIAKTDQPSQSEVLSGTLEALRDEGHFDDVAAVVVSGDLTNRAQPDGFREFERLISGLRGQAGAANVMVVPGNHDVPKEHGPADPRRYALFNAVTRKCGMSTPLLDGIDFTAKGQLQKSEER